MSDRELLIALLCVSPLISFLLCAFWQALVTQHRENITKRYPRYGQSEDMRNNGKRIGGKSRLN